MTPAEIEGIPPRAYWHPVTIEPGDIDELDHVNNAVYVRWMDRAALAHSEALGWPWSRYQQVGSAFMVRKHEIEYLVPALPGDDRPGNTTARAGSGLAVATWPSVMSKATAEREHRVVRFRDGQVLVRARTLWAFVDLTSGKPTRIPDAVRAAFKASM